MKLHIGGIGNLKCARVNIRVIRTMQTVRTVHRMEDRCDKTNTPEGKTLDKGSVGGG
jgi:hypothetical protein